jgi:hypothetical protein
LIIVSGHLAKASLILRFENFWFEREVLVYIVKKIWLDKDIPGSNIDKWQKRNRLLRKILKWCKNEDALYEKL